MLIVADNLPSDIGLRIKEITKLKMELKKTEAYQQAMRENKPRLFSEVILTPEEVRGHPPILLDLVTDAVILYDKGVLREELEKVRRRLQELGARKVTIPGKGWYWILKPNAKLGEVIKI